MKVAYVLKVYPRLSQTFILNEILAHQDAGSPVDIVSLRRPRDGRFHEGLSRVETAVTYIEAPAGDAADAWKNLGAGVHEFPALREMLPSLMDEDLADIEQALEVARLVRDRRIEHLHAHFGNVATTVARLAAQISGITYSFTAHARDIFRETVNPDVLRRKLADAAATITVSNFNLEYLRETYGDAANTVHRIYNGLDLRRFTFASPAERPPLILGVGRLVAKKGFGDLVEACAALAESGEHFRCEIAGDGPLEEELKLQIARRGLEDRVAMLGALPHDAIVDRLRQAAVLAAPCVIAGDGDRDGLPTILLEAMALGTPCVATDVTGIPEVLRHETTGLCVPQDSPAALADACRRLLGDGRLRDRLAVGARALIDEEFDIHRNTERMRKLLTRAARHPKTIAR